jgi:hypothetical protein
MDVKSTLFDGQIKEDVYVIQPLGVIVLSLEHKVCKLKKTLYGLHQSPQAWHERINVFLQKIDLVHYLSNHSLYIFQKDGLILALAIYANDLMLISNHNAKLKWVYDGLCSQFNMFLLGSFALYLGVEIFYTTFGVFLSRHWYILKCLFDFSLDVYIPNLVPIEPGLVVQN